ncbi:hypothetical protein [[Eubacterium] hominis]|uniref:hypothetical protein n=1 Tax=[Eubacterium] hominis TaxID=2764325 RepID=UPI003A4DC8CF
MESDKKIVVFDEIAYEVLKEDAIGGKNYYMAGPGHDGNYITGTVDMTFAAIGRAIYTLDGKSSEYLQVAEYYYGTLMRELQQIREREPKESLISEKDCNSIFDYPTLIGKLVVLKPDVLYPEFQNSTHQLYLAEGGFGCNPKSRGNAIFAENIYTGKRSRIERYELIGVIKKESLPQWAKVKLQEKEKDSVKGEER